MLKEITYNGITYSPSDYEAPDGDLASLSGLVNEDGSLKPMLPPKMLFSCQDGDRIVYLHKNETYRHFIVVNDAGVMSWYGRDGVKSDIPVYSFGQDAVFKDISSIGNIIVVCTDSTMMHFLWKNNDDADESWVPHYKPLGDHLPEVEIHFTNCGYFGVSDEGEGISRCLTVHQTSDIQKVDSLVNNMDIPHSGKKTVHIEGDEDQKKVSNAVIGEVNKMLADFRGKGLFVLPRLCRYALRLYNGDHVMFSRPFLVSLAGAKNCALVEKDHSELASSEGRVWGVSMFGHYLDYMIDTESLARLKEWKDIVFGVSFFLSSEVYDFDTNGTITEMEYDPSLSSSRFILPQVTEGDQSKRLENTFSFYKVFDLDTDDYAGRYGLVRMFKDGSNLAGDISGTFRVSVGSVTKVVQATPGDTLNSICKRLASEFENEGISCHILYCCYLDKSTSEDGTSQSAAICFDGACVNGAVFEKSGSSANVYLKCLNPSGMPLYPDKLPLGSLENQKAISDDYFSHNRFVPGTLYSYNARMIYADIRRKLYSPTSEFNSGFDAFQASGNVGFGLWVDHIEWSLVIGNENVTVRTDVRKRIIPSFLYYPDKRCNRCVMRVKDGQYSSETKAMVIPMTQSDFLNGSIFAERIPRLVMSRLTARIIRVENLTFNRYIVEDYSGSGISPEGYSELLPNIVVSSEVANPFSWTVKGAGTVSNSRVIALSSATKAMSQGQFGQFPVYAFTEDGTFALDITGEGYFSNPNIATRDVCTNRNSILQMDDSVLFVTRRGIMELAGKSSRNMTASILEGKPFGCKDILPFFSDVSSLVSIGDTLSPVEFTDFLEGCQMVRDYIHQRVVVFNPEYRYCYVFAEKSKCWSIQQCDYALRINSFPEAYVMASDGRLKDLSENDAVSDDAVIDSFILTRPIKLDIPNGLKTVNKIIQRGTFRTGHVGQVLWGSRDLFNWFALESSSNEYMRYCCGTPYKYFILAIACHLQKDESLYGCTVEYTPKYQNQVR